eukprot:CAMPEP_0119354264 /NCGR_PEP_ID=MMETSP1334-20130426/3277_1 /TAXON_ID=127549 /ORGANISM="Calcidiscus leptoporus, Strain RCC1130" /LENGTH=42 /DNA_ID= /DNA_START= /DNA_END= /DNA_ORIENTATION=
MKPALLSSWPLYLGDVKCSRCAAVKDPLQAPQSVGSEPMPLE